MLLSVGAYAQTVHRVTNGMNLQTVIDNAASGDVILVEGGNYGNITINKTLKIYGTGYLLSSVQQLNLAAAVLGNIIFANGSSGSILSGFQTDYVRIAASNIYLSRCFSGILSLGADGIGFNSSADNIMIKHCYITKFEAVGLTNKTVFNFSFKNNLIKQGFYLKGNVSGTIEQNTFNSDNVTEVSWSGGSSGFGNGTLYQMFLSPDLNNETCGPLPVAIKYNIFSTHLGANSYFNCGWGGCGSAQNICGLGSNLPPNFTGNIIQTKSDYFTFPNNLLPNNIILNSGALDALYLGYPNNPNNLSLDARNQLAPNSPARGAGEYGTDCGAFGGDDPYVLSGIPDIPIIYQLSVPSQVPQNRVLNVQIKAKTNN